MFVVKTADGVIDEDEGMTWSGLQHGIKGVYLVHPSLGISLALHGYGRYAFVVEGLATIPNVFSFPRVAEHIYAVKDKIIVHLYLHQSGRSCVEILDRLPEISDDIWRDKEGDEHGG